MFLIFKFTIVCALGAVDKAKKVHNFQVRSFMSKEFKGKGYFEYIRTLVSSHLNLYMYLGKFGLKLNKPYINFVINRKILFHF